MKKILPVLLVLLGVAEIILAVMDIRMPVMIALALGVIFIVLGFRALVNQDKKN